MMIDMWLDDLKTQIIDSKDSDNFEDIIKCYQNGLLRAGFLLAWLMLVESLKRKIVTLADKEVNVAKEELARITNQEEKLHSNDEYIWTGAVKCGLVSKEEESVIELLWKKRCIMSHPYMPEVKESDFRYMVENLVSISLSKSLVWSKTMIEDYIENIKSNVFLIPDEIDEKKKVADQIITLIPKHLYPFYWKTVFYELNMAIGNSHQKVQQMLLVMAMMIVKKVGKSINEPAFGLESRIRNYCVGCWAVFYPDKMWPLLSSEYQGQMFRFLKDSKKEAKGALGYAHSLISRKKDIEKKYIDCYYEALENYSVTDLERYYLDKDIFLKRLYDEKIVRWQFDEQKDFIEMLSSMDAEGMRLYNGKQIEKFGKYVEMCCYNETFRAQSFAKESNQWTKNSYFAKGFTLEGLTDSDGKLYISKKHMEFVLPVLYRLTDYERQQIFEALDRLPIGGHSFEEMISNNIMILVKRFFPEESYTYKAIEYLIGKFNGKASLTSSQI